MDAMREFTPQGGSTDTYGLTGDYVLKIERARGARVRVEMGAVWLTEERDPADICLCAGQSYCLERGGTALAVALRSTPLAIVRIERPVTRRFAERLWEFWAGLYAAESRPTSAAL